MTLHPGAAADAPLVTRGFVALSAATLAFFVAGGIVLPVAPTFLVSAALAAMASGLLVLRRRSLEQTSIDTVGSPMPTAEAGADV